MESNNVTLENVVNDPSEREKAKMFANLVLDKMGSNWFSIDEFVSKCKLSNENDALMRLLMLEQFNYCMVKNPGADVVKKHKGKTIFKISFDKSEIVSQIDKEISEYQLRIKILTQKKNSIQ